MSIEPVTVMIPKPTNRLDCMNAGEASMVAAVLRENGITHTCKRDGERYTFTFADRDEWVVKPHCAISFAALCRRTTNDYTVIKKDEYVSIV